jgi:hypothetical protein
MIPGRNRHVLLHHAPYSGFLDSRRARRGDVPRHDALVWLSDKQLFALDCATNRMSQLQVDLSKGSYAHECALVYDPKHDVCVALIPAGFTGPMQTFLYRYDPQTAKHR